MSDDKKFQSFITLVAFLHIRFNMIGFQYSITCVSGDRLAKLIASFLFPPACVNRDVTKSLYGYFHRMDFQIFLIISLL